MYVSIQNLYTYIYISVYKFISSSENVIVGLYNYYFILSLTICRIHIILHIYYMYFIICYLVIII